MYVFSEEWIYALADLLKNDEVYQQKAKDFDSSFQFVVKANPARGVQNDLACGVNLPQCDKIWAGIQPNTDYVMSGPYETFHKILKGKMGAVMAITTRKVKVQGNLAKLLKFTGAINRFVELLGQVDSEFEGDFK